MKRQAWYSAPACLLLALLVYWTCPLSPALNVCIPEDAVEIPAVECEDYAPLSQEPGLNIIPKPLRIDVADPSTHFLLTSDTKLVFEFGNNGAKSAAEFLAHVLRRGTSYELQVVPDKVNPTDGVRTIVFTGKGANTGLGDEGYILHVTEHSVVAQSSGAAGLFYAAQTLRQLLPAAINLQHAPNPCSVSEWRIPCATIEDTPRFSWRGVHLDIGRHFFDKDQILQFIDAAAFHKLNVFHLHLTEDQGWRFESKKYPKLVTVGAFRNETMGDGKPYGSYLTQDECREIVAYAAARHMEVMPEIEMPGHATAAIAAYPELGNNPDKQLTVGTVWGVVDTVFNVQEETFTFLQNILLEVMDIFPSTFIHIGGDEVPKKEWSENEHAQQVIKTKGLKDEHHLQSWFVNRISKFLEGHGRRLVGWDEILEGGLADGATVMSWRGMNGGIAAANASHDVVMSPTSHAYFNYYQHEDKELVEPMGRGAFVGLEKVYSFEPIPESLSADKHKHVLGAQGNLWTEHISTFPHLMYMTYPRLCAMAEVVWSPRESREFSEFEKRMNFHYARLDSLGVNYRDYRKD